MIDLLWIADPPGVRDDRIVRALIGRAAGVHHRFFLHDGDAVELRRDLVDSGEKVHRAGSAPVERNVKGPAGTSPFATASTWRSGFRPGRRSPPSDARTRPPKT